MKPPSERFASKYEVDRTTGCWNWTGCRDPKGYGMLSAPGGGSPLRAHRVSYELHVAPIGAGLHIDHLCRNTSCVNPDHLEAVTPQINMLRGESPQAKAVRTNRCGRDHELSPENTWIRGDGHRVCRECQRVRRSAQA